MMWTDDPVRDWDRHCEEQERELQRYPKCCKCGERLTEDYIYCIEDEYYCDRCLNKHFWVPNPID